MMNPQLESAADVNLWLAMLIDPTLLKPAAAAAGRECGAGPFGAGLR